MSEPTYEKGFQAIRSNLVPKSQFEEAQKEISILKLQLETAKKSAKKPEYDDQKLKIDIVRAEKETLEYERKTLKKQFKEVSLKLKQKTQEYDSLLKTTQTDCSRSNKESQAIGIVNVPAPSSSRSDEPGMQPRSKRRISAGDNEKRTSAKRTKASKTATNKRTVVQQFSCEICLLSWGYKIDCDCDFENDQNNCGVPHPKTEIATFATFKQYKDHYFTVHDEYSQEQIDNGCYKTEDFCQEKSCLDSFEGSDQWVHTWPHGDINCAICGLSFEFMEHHDAHIKVEHANINMMSKKEVFDLFQFSSSKFSES